MKHTSEPKRRQARRSTVPSEPDVRCAAVNAGTVRKHFLSYKRRVLLSHAHDGVCFAFSCKCIFAISCGVFLTFFVTPSAVASTTVISSS